MLPVGNMEMVIFSEWKLIFALQIFLHIGLNCKIKFLLRLEFTPTGQIFNLQAPIFIMITEVWPHANQAMVTNNSTVIIEVVLIEGFLYITYNVPFIHSTL